jgi:hypothetical protein
MPTETSAAVEAVFNQAARYIHPDADPKVLKLEDRVGDLERKIGYLERRLKIFADLLLNEGGESDA